MSIHYSKYANDAFRVEYIGRKPRNACIKTIQVEKECVRTNFLLFSPDGTRILSHLKQDVCVWDATSGERIIGPLTGDDKSRVLSAAFLHGGRYIVDIRENGIIRKWDVLTSSLVWRRVMGEGQIDWRQMESAVFSPDRKSIVFGDNQGSIQVWDVDTVERDGSPLEGHTSHISCLSFSSDGRYLVSGSKDTTVMIWDLDKRSARTGPLRSHTGGVTAVDFSKVGNTIISGSEDGNIYIWDVNSEKSCARLSVRMKYLQLRTHPMGSLFSRVGRSG